MAEAQFPDSKLRKLAPLPETLKIFPPLLLRGPPRAELIELMSCAMGPVVCAEIALADSVDDRYPSSISGC